VAPAPGLDGGLVEELRASRQRIVAAQDQERRKLERNIHDGAQQQLVALAIKANLTEQLVGRDDERARSMAAQLKSDAQDALENLRDLARGIYPPLLADQGLTAIGAGELAAVRLSEASIRGYLLLDGATLTAGQFVASRRESFELLRRGGVLGLDVVAGQLSPALVERYLELKERALL